MHDIHPGGEAGAKSRAAESTVEPGLLVEERRRRICDLLQESGRVTVMSLASRFATSAVTIRADLAALERIGAVVRSHGGALLPRDGLDQPLTVKETLHHTEKVRIARLAVSLIRDGETIILDSGTTTAEIAKQIREAPLQSINVITNALNVATLLASAPTVRLIMPGGILRRESNSLSGHIGEAALAELRADRLFLGADAIDPTLGVMTPHLPEAQLNLKMIEIARQVVAVADSSKLMRRNISVIARVEQLDMLITDAAASPPVVDELRRRGVEVLLA
ncbi:MAG TPA: DeoR/GlpR family DNA-binding transcription regulator [Steroidobacteraceae bacterium]|nr:DeoR/GlpR family DNA-binding transcription regulator [Steroidobacteraceae bacterium]